MKEIIDFFTLDPSDTRIFAAQLIGFLSLGIGLFTFALSKRQHILITKLACDLTAAIHFFMLGAVVGGATCSVNTVRSIVFYYRGDKKWASSIASPIIIGIATLSCSIIGWQGASSLLPTCGSVLAIIGFWCNDPKLIKFFNLPAVTLWLIYNVITGSISSALSNGISIITIMASFIIAWLSRRKEMRSMCSVVEGADIRYFDED